MKDLYTNASEAYMGGGAILGLTPYVVKAQGYYAAGDIDNAFKVLKDLAKEIKEIFNFKEVTINLNETITGFRIQDLFDIDGINSSATKSISSCYFVDYGNQPIKDKFVVKNGTYKCKYKDTHCDLSIYAPIMLDAKQMSPEEFLALLLREIGYKFYVWSIGDDLYGVFKYIIRFIMAYTRILDSILSLSFKIKSPISAALTTARFFIIPYLIDTESESATKSGFLKLIFDKVLNFTKNSVVIMLAPIISIVCLLYLPINTLMGFVFSKVFNMKFNDCDNFADEFCAAYGLGPELIKAGYKEQYGKGIDKISSLVCDFMGISTALYTATSLNIGGCTHKSAVLPRLDNLVRYYTEELKKVSDKKKKDEIVKKIKALQESRKQLMGLPETKWSPGQVFVRWYSTNFGANGEAMERLDKKAKVIDKTIKS